jgi:thiamine-monophosphate kinase
VKISERQFTRVLQQRAGPRRGSRIIPGLRQGIGDDCAVLAHTRRKDLLVTTDLFIEGIHFRREWQEPDSLGHKALARGLSDIAAMGGTPRFVFLSAGVPRNVDDKWLDGFLDGFLRLAAQYKVVLAGGDTGASAGGFLADVVVLGDVSRGSAVLRSGARPGDEIWVSGKLGTAAAGLAALRRGKRSRRSDAAADAAPGSGPGIGFDPALRAFRYPEPRLQIGAYLRQRKLASAMMDLSDGLSIDLARLCEVSGVGAEIDAAAIPRLAGITMKQALHGGEDFELLFTVPSKRSSQLPRSMGGVPLTRVGRITSARKLYLLEGERRRPLPILGFQHF